MKLNHNAVVFWAVCFLGGYLFGNLHIGLIALFVSMIISLVVTALK